MKKVVFAAIGLLCSVYIFSCQKELMKFENPSSIYFYQAGKTTGTKRSRLRYSFGYSKEDSFTVGMVVSTIGRKQNTDRPYRLMVKDSANAEGLRFYEILNPTFVIKKDKLTDTVFIRFLRIPEMQNRNFVLKFELLENENFNTNMNFKVLNIAKKDTLFYTKSSLVVDDIISRPALWGDGSLGTFSRKKMLLMVQVLNVDFEYMNTTMNAGEILAYGKFMQRYLNEQKAAGNIIIDENNKPMVMGRESQ
ncbi:DUF4843 domain-containing protein [Sphingobacterium spiritivorum]|uniref:DUF4843 domain-containing protein n=1 Tax=Sphingobacterium spiritivorum TaxID=258 RepID=UPI003DA292E5